MSMTQIANNPLLQTKNLMKVIQEIETDTGSFRLAKEVPLETIQETKVVVDVRTGAGGMTQLARQGAESPIVAFYGVSQFTYEPAQWREKVLLTPNEMMSMRKLGTLNEVEKVQSIIARHLGDLRMRLETRMEWLRWQALFGSITVTQKDLELSIDFNVPADMKPVLTGADLWSASTSDPMDDLLSWLEKYRDISAHAASFMFNAKMLRIIMQNSKIRDLRDAMFTGQSNLNNLTVENLKSVFTAYAGIPYEVYDGGYMEVTELTSAVASSGTSLVVRDLGTIAAGDSVNLIDARGQNQGRVRLTVASVTHSTKTIVVSSPGADQAYPAGSRVHVKKFFIPDGQFVIRGELPSGVEGGDNWASIISTLHEYGTNPLVPQAGVFAKTVVKEDDDPPKVELIVGFNGLPIVFHPDVHVLATVM